MTKNTARINDGIRAIAQKPYEIMSGTVVAGSIDTTGYTMSVQPTDDGAAIENVMLNAVTGNGNGIVLIPEEGSHVVIGTVDGPGEWVLLSASKITQGTITIENVMYTMDSTHVNIKNGATSINISSDGFKMTTANENLFQFLRDLLTYITELTVSTPSGVSGIPVNVSDFSNLLVRLSNLLVG